MANTTWTEAVADLKAKILNAVADGTWRTLSISKPDGTSVSYTSVAEWFDFLKKMEAMASDESETISSPYRPVYLRTSRFSI